MSGFLGIMLSIIFFVTPEKFDRIQVWPYAASTNSQTRELSLTFQRTRGGWCPDFGDTNQTTCMMITNGLWMDETGKVLLDIKNNLKVSQGTNYVFQPKGWDNPLEFSVRGNTSEKFFEIKEAGKVVRVFKVRMSKSNQGEAGNISSLTPAKTASHGNTGVQCVSTFTTNSTGAIVTTDAFTRNGQTNLIRVTKLKSGVVVFQRQTFCHNGVPVAYFVDVKGIQSFGTVTNAPYEIHVDFLQNKEIRAVWIYGSDDLTHESFIDGWYPTNGVYYPAPDSDLECKDVNDDGASELDSATNASAQSLASVEVKMKSGTNECAQLVDKLHGLPLAGLNIGPARGVLPNKTTDQIVEKGKAVIPYLINGIESDDLNEVVYCVFCLRELGAPEEARSAVLHLQDELKAKTRFNFPRDLTLEMQIKYFLKIR